jgi:hypothetical protein
MKANTNSNPTATLLGIVTGFVLLYFFFEANWLLYVAAGVGLIGLFIKPAARWIEWGWMSLTRLIGFVNSRIILSLVFFLILLPVSLFYRLSKKDPLQLKQKKGSYFIDRNHRFEPKDLENPW